MHRRSAFDVSVVSMFGALCIIVFCLAEASTALHDCSASFHGQTFEGTRFMRKIVPKLQFQLACIVAALRTTQRMYATAVSITYSPSSTCTKSGSKAQSLGCHLMPTL